MWATPDHPDPDGEQLRDVAKYLRWLQEAGGRTRASSLRSSGTGPALPGQARRLALEGADQAVQVRADECQPLVLPPQHALAHESEDAGGAICELLSKRLDGEEGRVVASRLSLLFLLCFLRHASFAPFYYLFHCISIVQTFERGVSEFVKDHRGVMDLHSVLRTLADKEVSDERKGSFFAVAQACGALAQAGPPVAPEAMKARFAACCFSNGADDLAVVERSYRETFEQVLGKSSS